MTTTLRLLHLIKLFLLIAIGGVAFVQYAQSQQLSQNAEISLITVDPSNENVYTLYGHTALRVKDDSSKIDAVFNYGIFDFSKPNFIYRFSKGETDYRLEAYPFPYFLSEYEMRGSGVSEQVLNLTLAEKQNIWEALLENNRPENKVYRYNFFFDNCATRPIDIISNNIDGKVEWALQDSPISFRDIINKCTREHPWQTFGCDLALGSPTDRLITAREERFLPSYLKKAVARASIVSHEGESRQLVKEAKELSAPIADEEENSWAWITPDLACWIFFFIVMALTFVEWKEKTYWPIIDYILFSIAGLWGAVLYFLCFISTHPCIWPNWNIVWLQPLDLVAVILFAVKRFKKAAFYYHFINFAALTLLLIGWHFIPQHLNTAFIPLILSIWLRSGYGIYRKIWNIE